MTEPISSPLRGAERAAADPMLSSNPASPRRFSIEDAVGAVAMALLALITFTNVVVRYLTNESFAWSEEVSVSLMVILTLVAGSAAVVRDRHIRIAPRSRTCRRGDHRGRPRAGDRHFPRGFARSA